MKTQTLSIMPRLRNLIVCSAILGVMASCLAMANTRNSMQEYHFDIAEYELSFSVPKAFLSGMWNRPDRYNPEWKKGRRGEGSYAEYFFHTHWFKGPVWVGNYASAIFIIRIIEADSEYSGQISTLDDLDKYLNWEWMFDGSKTYHPKISRKTISGFDWIQTTIEPSNSKKNVNRGPENTILWFPLGNRRCLMVLWQIDESVPGKTYRWLEDAHEMRDLILDSIVLRKSQAKDVRS